jgi:hypothetical protein
MGNGAKCEIKRKDKDKTENKMKNKGKRGQIKQKRVCEV